MFNLGSTPCIYNVCKILKIQYIDVWIELLSTENLIVNHITERYYKSGVKHINSQVTLAIKEGITQFYKIYSKVGNESFHIQKDNNDELPSKALATRSFKLSS